MARITRKEIIERFNLRGSRFEIAFDKNGNPWSYQFGRSLPPYGHANRSELMRVPETLHFSDQSRPAFHGLKCGGCVHFEFCAKHKGAREWQNYCAMPSRGYMREGESCPVTGYATPVPWGRR